MVSLDRVKFPALFRPSLAFQANRFAETQLNLKRRQGTGYEISQSLGTSAKKVILIKVQAIDR